jgi:cob(I)alamin adenosyltransferase
LDFDSLTTMTAVGKVTLRFLLSDQKSMTSSPPNPPARKGLVEIFTGEGKGKTSAALGVVLRALGHDFRVCIVHFMKGTFPYGEQKSLAGIPNVTVRVFGSLEFVDPHNVKEEDRREARMALEYAREAMLSGKYDLVVLDEVNVASGWGLVPVEDVVNLVREKPEDVELILTGRYADKRLLEVADLVTEMVCVKHPFERGVKARPGVDY